MTAADHQDPRQFRNEDEAKAWVLFASALASASGIERTSFAERGPVLETICEHADLLLAGYRARMEHTDQLATAGRLAGA